jgi:hypothetical protein
LEQAWNEDITLRRDAARDWRPVADWHVNMPILRIENDRRRASRCDERAIAESGKPMTKSDAPSPQPATADAPRHKELPEAAKRALAEAEARRLEAAKHAEVRAKEVQGPKGPEPTRYGDWEVKGIASDF